MKPADSVPEKDQGKHVVPEMAAGLKGCNIMCLILHLLCFWSGAAPKKNDHGRDNMKK